MDPGESTLAKSFAVTTALLWKNDISPCRTREFATGTKLSGRGIRPKQGLQPLERAR